MIATALGEQRGVHVLIGSIEKKSYEIEIKSVTDPEQRVELLKGVIRIAGEDGKLPGKLYFWWMIHIGPVRLLMRVVEF